MLEGWWSNLGCVESKTTQKLKTCPHSERRWDFIRPSLSVVVFELSQVSKGKCCWAVVLKLATLELQAAFLQARLYQLFISCLEESVFTPPLSVIMPPAHRGFPEKHNVLSKEDPPPSQKQTKTNQCCFHRFNHLQSDRKLFVVWTQIIKSIHAAPEQVTFPGRLWAWKQLTEAQCSWYNKQTTNTCSLFFNIMSFKCFLNKSRQVAARPRNKETRDDPGGIRGRIHLHNNKIMFALPQKVLLKNHVWTSGAKCRQQPVTSQWRWASGWKVSPEKRKGLKGRKETMLSLQSHIKSRFK